jgi:hypothetical protein
MTSAKEGAPEPTGLLMHSIEKWQSMTRRELTVDISMMIRWIVVFLVIFILLMFFVFSFFKKQSTA